MATKIKKRKNKRNYWWIFGIASFVILVIMLFGYSRQTINQISLQTPTITPSGPFTYTSKKLHFTITVPQGFEIDDIYQTDIVLNDKEGKINIYTIGTNYKTIDEELALADRRNQLPQKIERKHITINGQDAVVAIVESSAYPDLPQVNFKAYYFYPEPWRIYAFSTSVPALYDDLDQIAQSFKYTP